jgi:hypothetical protein
MILLLTRPDDEHVQVVADKLMNRGADYVWFDHAEYPRQAQISLNYSGTREMHAELCVGGERFDLNRVTAAWNRRPSDPTPHPEMPDVATREHVRREAKKFLSDVWHSLDCLWIPGPDDNVLKAQHKAAQLKLAESLGFEIPPTLITNNPQQLLQFYSQHNGRIVSKAHYYAFMLPEGETSPERLYHILTSVVSNREVGYAHAVRYGPVIFQAYVPKRLELRITVVGQQVFAAEIHSQQTHHTRHDWRRYDLVHTPHRPHDLPEDVRRLCLRLVERLGLCFGAIDMVLTPDGRYVFIEINPSGQYAWIEELTGLPISDAICDLLISGEA